MKLIPISPFEDKSKELYQSAECQELIAMYPGYYASIGYNPPWVGYFVVKDGNIAGSCGFKGQPIEGKVEIAYWTFPAYENRGIARQACRLLVELSLKTDPSLIISAQTLPQENASTRILRHNGFKLAGTAQDDEVGEVWEWIWSEH